MKLILILASLGLGTYAVHTTVELMNAAAQVVMDATA
jgi:hypothetical protein